jgi:hypothetical protein
MTHTFWMQWLKGERGHHGRLRPPRPHENARLTLGLCRQATPRRRRFAPRLEVLEDRTVPSPVHALFDLTTPANGPFPSDRFTVGNPDNLTGLASQPAPARSSHAPRRLPGHARAQHAGRLQRPAAAIDPVRRIHQPESRSTVRTSSSSAWATPSRVGTRAAR